PRRERESRFAAERSWHTPRASVSTNWASAGRWRGCRRFSERFKPIFLITLCGYAIEMLDGGAILDSIGSKRISQRVAIEPDGQARRRSHGRLVGRARGLLELGQGLRRCRRKSRLSRQPRRRRPRYRHAPAR